MTIRKKAPMGFVYAALEHFGSSRTANLLDKLDAATLWGTLARPITLLTEYKDLGAG